MKRHLAATLALLVASVTLYLNLRYSNLAWEEAGDPLPLPKPMAEKTPQPKRNEDIGKNREVVQKKPKLARKLLITTAKNVSRNSIKPVKKVSRKETSSKSGTKHEKLTMLQSERQNIAEEMKHYKFRPADRTLDSLIPERGGHPVRAVVRTKE